MKPLLLCALVLLANGPLAAQRSRRGCPEVSTDSVPGGPHVYLACQVDREAKTRGIAPRMDWTPPASDLRGGSCFRAEFQFVVDSLGMPDVATIREVGSNNASYQQAVRDVIPRLRYSPAVLKGAPVRQLVTFQQSAALRVEVSSSPSARPGSSRPPRC